ncbi:hypothetical protein AJ85_09510 [Alkalihalobacillus alcalophilus ATCC 27647 = CGMCC 1.3604]|uniref:Thioredoxin reductase n=1 Tax=Alkalihalobacillus alcalophilus ATCC 27647 = CGMCC 1.3604 TaxID=1218173 RepID=A0A094WN43_ALKAL|nr:YpdA family putative bacillithiol disulfide reductase [Alkalihalobacillus alcalophilus]KGA99174.1 hypothetical protein BALCAV_0200525 [Alkalihalobacillus alcalophilus ATCC 27647 = CGMCC 1.3604]MED1562498.1 YpdA family putative bacillithiol disulfide reductase [Alkalihalobacillus alcalophilus]THG90640.1 hypothetical protein AJ85_09510 [Alkalihalobacillus alcalophilus ATCC 27647 = CGMCC 1.3604]
MKREKIIIIGAGPCGLAAAISCQEAGFDPLIIEKENIVNTIYRFPTHQMFFSTSERLEIGDVAFVTEERKPKRNQALSYYRDVVKRKKLRIHSFEKVESVAKIGHAFKVVTEKEQYEAAYVIIATGYYDSPNYLHVPGENSAHVFHYFKEAHPFFGKDVVVIGGKNSAVDATLELEKAGANVTVLYRGLEYSSSVKPWILPEYEALVRNEMIAHHFGAEVVEITKEEVIYSVEGETKRVKADFVFAMTGYHPDHAFLKHVGVGVDDESGRPKFDEETMETNVQGLYIAGVIAAGNNANEIFIENGRFHGDSIVKSILAKES